MSESGEDSTKFQETSGKMVDITDQNELDYEEEELNNQNNLKKTNENANEGGGKFRASNLNEDSDGELKSEFDDGEVETPKDKKKLEDGDDEISNEGEIKNENRKDRFRNEKQPTEESKPLSEEEGEINDGEKVKKAFVPKIVCKFFQRGKCSWGRVCKFLHPGVNDTGNYTFLEVDDPNARVYQQSRPNATLTSNTDEQSEKTNTKDLDAAPTPLQNETAWEKALRHAKEMKEKAKQRKLAEQKDDFLDKKMNLSLKEFENEKENDERYLNIENAANADDDLEDEDLQNYVKSGKLNRKAGGGVEDRGGRTAPSFSGQMNRSYDQSSTRYRSSHPNASNHPPSRRSRSPNNRFSGSSGARPNRPDDWHDPWDRSRPTGNSSKRVVPGKKDDRASYSSSDSDSRSRSGSSNSSRSSYSSRSSSRSSYSSRSPSPSAKRGGAKNAIKKSSRAPVVAKDASKIAIKPVAAGKVLPNRHVSDVSLKKAISDKKKARSRSRSSSSSYSSSSSKSASDAGSGSGSESSADSYSDEEKNHKKSKRPVSDSKSKHSGLKRSAPDNRERNDSKKSKIASPPSSATSAAKQDKKQMIKDQLKLLENALAKKKAMAK